MSHEKYSFRFDVRGLITTLGGTKRTHEILCAAGSPVEFKTVQKWIERGHLPPGALAVIVRHQTEKGEAFDLNDFVIPA